MGIVKKLLEEDHNSQRRLMCQEVFTSILNSVIVAE